MEQDFEGSRIFLNIPIAIAHDKDLLKKSKSILLFGEIYSMLNVTGKFFMSNQVMAKRLDVSTVTIADYLNLLENKGLIKRERRHDERGMVIGRKITAGPAIVKYILQSQLASLNRSSKADLTQSVKPTLQKKNSIKEQSNRTDIYKNSAAKAAPHIPYKEIINYLNVKTNQHLHYTTKSYQKLIKARWEDGYKLDDFKKVIDNQAFSWQGTKFWKYMRPSTLFRASKFDEYLNANDLNNNQSQGGGYGGAPTDLDQDDDDLPY